MEEYTQLLLNCKIWLCFCSQYQEEIDALNQVARHRPRSSLVLGIQQENRQIRELQQENRGRTELHMVDGKKNNQICSLNLMVNPGHFIKKQVGL